jgi:hypothetical protein
MNGSIMFIVLFQDMWGFFFKILLLRSFIHVLLDSSLSTSTLGQVFSFFFPLLRYGEKDAVSSADTLFLSILLSICS